MTRRDWLYVLVGGAIVGALAWIDPVFIPLVLLGPLVHGAVEGWRGVGWRCVAGVWAVGGLAMTVSDYVVNQEDVGFHLALTVLMPALASLPWFAASRLRRR